MRIRRAITAAAAVATITAGTLAAFATPSYAAVPKKCTTYNQGGWTGDVCVTYFGLGSDIFKSNADVTAFPSNCATIRVDLLNRYGVLDRAGTSVACRTGNIAGGLDCGSDCLDPRERAAARVNAYDSAGNLIFTAQSDVLASPFAPPLP